MEPAPAVALVTLGCARNDVDSEELAARLEADGFRLVEEPADAAAVLVNTCGFVAAAAKDSIDTLLELSDTGGPERSAPPPVVAVGCLAERYGVELADALPEAAAVLGFDDYPLIADRIRAVLAGERPPSHRPRDRRRLLPLAPVDRATTRGVCVPGHGQLGQPDLSDLQDLPTGRSPASGPRPVRRRLDGSPTAPLKIASGCDRRCSFCAIPSFRGAFVSRRPEEVLAEARWLAGTGVRELFLVSENSTSYGKDLGVGRLLETLLPQLAGVAGIERVRVSYLQPAEMRPSLVEVIATTPGVAPYFDLSFQHASGGLLRAMRRFGDAERFLALLADIRVAAPSAGARSNVIVGFPGETEEDLDVLCEFLVAARLDAIGVFGFSAEEGTAAAALTGQLDEVEIRDRVERVSRFADELTAQRAAERVGEPVEVLVESLGSHGTEGRTAFQGPEVDGTTRVLWSDAPPAIGALVPAVVSDAVGVDLLARPRRP